MKKGRNAEERSTFLSKVAAVSIATAFGRTAATARVAPAQRASFKATEQGKPEGSVLKDGDLAKPAQSLNEHPDGAVRAVLKQTAEELAAKEDVQGEFRPDVHGALKALNIDVPAEILSRRLQMPGADRQAAPKRDGASAPDTLPGESESPTPTTNVGPSELTLTFPDTRPVSIRHLDSGNVRIEWLPAECS